MPRLGSAFAAAAALFREAAQSWFRDHAQSMGVALAFYTIFSIAPLLLMVIAVAGAVFGEESARGEIYYQLQGMLGTTRARAVQDLLESAHRPADSVPAAVVGLVVLFVAATSVFAELQDSLDRIWRAPQRSAHAALWGLLRARLLSFGMILGIGFLLLVTAVFALIYKAMPRANIHWRDVWVGAAVGLRPLRPGPWP